MNLEECLPAGLRGAGTTIAKIAAGLSGAGVHRVDADGRAFVLKVTADDQPLANWQRTLFILRAASEAGLAPRVVHVDEARRAVVSEFVADQSFPRLYRDPLGHESALTLLGETLRRVHALPIPPGSEPSQARQLFGTIWSSRPATLTIPCFATEAAERALADEPPFGRPLVLSHNDANPTNVVFDGRRILFLDWDAAAPNDPCYDLAVVSLFQRMDEETSRRLIAAHDGGPPQPLPPAFLYYRRLTGMMLGLGFLYLAHQVGHSGAATPETLDGAPPLIEFYQKMQSGALSLDSGDGRWAFGLGLIKEAHAL